MSDKKNSKPAIYRPNLPELKPPQTSELADIILHITQNGLKKPDVFTNYVEAPKRIQ